MKRIFLRLKQPLRNERGEITFFACFFVVGIVMLISFLLLYASIRITCINIRNGAKMELNNLSGTIYADTYRSQRETNFEEYLNTLYSSSDYTDMLEATVAGGLDSKIPLSTEDYKVSDISLDFNVENGRVEYIFYCDVEFYVRMFGHSYPLQAYPGYMQGPLARFRLPGPPVPPWWPSDPLQGAELAVPPQGDELVIPPPPYCFPAVLPLVRIPLAVYPCLQ